jgi:signal transduction histidine kinase
LRERLGIERLEHALTWLEGMLTVRSLLNTIEQSTKHICELVGAVKDYTYMDRSTVQDVNVHDGLESTLTIMGYKLRDVAVIRDYATDLPPITAHGSRLNQVWTNLIDNAVEAMGERGKLEVRTWREDDSIVVEIADNGPGIPPEIQKRIYEPFFTTKDVGRGTGLGLDIVYHIVRQEHRGEIRLQTEPGNTRFQVYLPLQTR